MNINLTSMIVILCAIIALIVNVRSIFSIKNIKSSKRYIVLLLRVLLILLITFGTTGLSFDMRAETIHTVFLVDRSSSISNQKENIELFINDAINRKDSHDKVSILSFGADLSSDYTSFFDERKVSLNSIINDNATNYEIALSRAREMILSSESGRVVLISDGLENQSDYNKEIEEYRLRNIELKFVKIDSIQGVDSQVTDISLPKDITVGESFQIDLEVHSTKSSNAILRIYKGSKVFSEKEIRLKKGQNNFTYKDVLYKSGNQIYTAEIDMMGDYHVNNNRFSSMTNGIGSPRLLIIADENESYISNLVADNGFKSDKYLPSQAPSELKNLLKYHGVILSNVTLEETPDNFLSSLKTYVDDYGGGLFVSGGPKSYALGGYYKTELEEMLPVNMEMKRDGILPSVSMVVIIDRSGSMGGTKIDMAKEAARKAVEAMKPNDYMAVLAFDDTRAWVSKLTSTDNKDQIIDAIGTIKASGGTSILPALRDAIDELKNSKSKLKHIILLTDGQAESSGYDPIIEEAIDNEITISTIALGQGSDTRLLNYIAESGMGRFYDVKNPSNIPSIFTKETFLASKSYINEDAFTPVITSDSYMVKALYSEIYDLLGYVSTSLKPNAELILKTDKDEPLLASWNYGLGKVNAWTSDSAGIWSSSLLSSESGKSMFLNIINDTLIDSTAKDINISTSQNGSNVDILLGREDLSTAVILDEFTLIDKDGVEKTYKGEIYNKQFVKANLNNIEQGLYIIKTSATLDEKIIHESKALLINYSSEYDIRSGQDISTDLIEKFDGSYIEESNQVFTDIESKVYDKKDFTNILLILAIIVFILDVYIRRFRNDRISDLVSKLYSRVKSKGSKAAQVKINRVKKANDSIRVTYKNDDLDAKSKKDNSIIKEKVRANALGKESGVDTSDMAHLGRLLKAKEKRK